MLISTTNNPSVDDVLSQIVGRYEAKFPGRVRGYYLMGSYEELRAGEI